MGELSGLLWNVQIRSVLDWVVDVAWECSEFGYQSNLDHLEEETQSLYLILLSPGHLTLSQSSKTRGWLNMCMMH